MSTTIKRKRTIFHLQNVLWTQDLFFSKNVMLILLILLSTLLRETRSLSAALAPHGPPIEDYSKLGMSISKILNSFFDSGYDKRVRPNYGGKPVEVGVTMFIISISTVSEVNMDFTTDFYFRQAWQDPRLSFEKTQEIDNLYVGAEVAEKIWVPDTFFANEKSAYFHKATTFNTFLRIGHMGDVFRSIR